MKIAYMMSRFPKLTETFILYEILAMEKLGIEVELYPLMREQTKTMHPGAKPLVDRAHFFPMLSWEIIKSNLSFFDEHPIRYLRTLYRVVKGTWRNPRFLAGAILFFPKTVHMARKMKAEGVTHVHAHFATHPTTAAYAIRELVDIPYSFTAHGSDVHKDQTMLGEKAAKSAFAVTISDFNSKVILGSSKERISHKLRIIRCGVDPDVFQPRAPRALNSDEPLRLICIGSLHEVKGQKYLIEACRLLKDRGVRFHCDFVGDGVDREQLEAAVAQAGLSDAITFHGHQERESVVNLLSKADVAVSPSVPSSDGRREGIPVVLMEAMACSLPVVSSQLSGIPELVTHGENGFLTEPGDAGKIADYLEQLYREPELYQRLGQSARERVVKDFNLNTNIKQLADEIKRVQV